MTAPIRSMPELVAALREWRDERGITHEVFDGIAGWPHGYAGKLLAPNPIKNLGWASLGLALDTLAIELIVIENPEQRKLVEGRWKRRERPKNLPSASMSASMQNSGSAIVHITPELHRKLVDLKHMKRIAKLGAKRRNKVMKKRARQRAASHAARMRWSKNGKTT